MLVERYQESAFRAAYLILRDATSAEDVTQEAFVRAYRQIGAFRQGEPFRPWLLRIVQNLALNEVRSRGRHRGLVARVGALAVGHEEPADARVGTQDDASALLDAMARLPERDRVVLHLRYFLELPEREIAIVVGTAPGTVKSRLHRAGKRLKELIEREYPQLMERGDG